MEKRLIICVGNLYVPSDIAGPCVLVELSRRSLPGCVELVDGGLLGLNLLRLMEGTERVVFVDALNSGADLEGVYIFEPADLSDIPPNYDHAAGIAYLLAALPAACPPPLPNVIVVGVAGRITNARIREAAETALGLAVKDDVRQLEPAQQ